MLAGAVLIRPVPLVAVPAAPLVRPVFIGTVLVGSCLARTVPPLALLWATLAPAGIVVRAARGVRPARARPLPLCRTGRRVPGIRVIAGIGPLPVPGIWSSLASRTVGGRSLRGPARLGTAGRGTGDTACARSTWGSRAATGRSPRFVRDKNV